MTLFWCSFIDSDIEPVLDLGLSNDSEKTDDEDESELDSDEEKVEEEEENNTLLDKEENETADVDIDMNKWGSKRAYFGADFVDDELDDTDEEDLEKGSVVYISPSLTLLCSLTYPTPISHDICVCVCICVCVFSM
jgi:5'-3' exonuclease